MLYLRCAYCKEPCVWDGKSGAAFCSKCRENHTQEEMNRHGDSWHNRCVAKLWDKYRNDANVHQSIAPEWFDKLVSESVSQGIHDTCEAYFKKMDCGHPEAVRGDPVEDGDRGLCEWCESLKDAHRKGFEEAHQMYGEGLKKLGL